MGRPPKIVALDSSHEIAAEVVARVEQQNTDAAEHSQKAMAEYGDGQPYSRIRLVGEARFYLTQSAETMLEAGRRLIVIKEHEPHGEFQNIIENEVGIDRNIARKMMQAAAKFLSPRLSSNQEALTVLGKTKLYSLMLEDDDELEALADGGTLLGMTLDEIDRMSTRELRKALRDRDADEAAKNEVAANKSKRIDELQTEIEKLKRHAETITPDARDGELRAEAQLEACAIESMIRGRLCPLIAAALENGETNCVDAVPWVNGVFDVMARVVEMAREQFGSFGGVMDYAPHVGLATAVFDADGPWMPGMGADDAGERDDASVIDLKQ